MMKGRSLSECPAYRPSSDTNPAWDQAFLSEVKIPMHNCHAHGLTSDNPRRFSTFIHGKTSAQNLIMGKASETLNSQETSRDKVNHMPLPDVSTGIKVRK